MLMAIMFSISVLAAEDGQKTTRDGKRIPDAVIATALGDWVTVKATRLPNNPIITPSLFAIRKDGDNINGPVLIRAPSWIAKPLGAYYLYFAHHGGKYIRLAYADALTGPWKLHEGGVLGLDQLPVKMDHIASPEIVVDEQAKRITMYYHGTVRQSVRPVNTGKWSGQLTFAATSVDGLAFSPRAEVISSFYLKVFPYGGLNYGICKDGNIGNQLARGKDPLAGFEQGPKIIANGRHVALLPKGDTLWVFFSRAGDCPEQILMTRFNLKEDWTKWGVNAPPPIAVLKPEQPWEGIQYELAPSGWSSGVRVQEVRDPFVFEDGGKLYLLYSVAGEMGIAIAELEFSPKDKGPQIGKAGK